MAPTRTDRFGMPRRQQFLAAVFLTAVVALLLLSDLQAGQYVITELISDHGQLGPTTAASINNAGQVGYRFKTDATADDVYRYDVVSDTNTQVYEVGGDPWWNMPTFHPAINNHGQIAFEVSLWAGGNAIVRGDGGTPVTIAVDNNADPCSPFYSIDREVDINDANRVAFWGRMLGTYDHAIYVGDGGPLTEIALCNVTLTDTGHTFNEINNYPVINSQGAVAFVGRLNPYNANHLGIFGSDGTTVSAIYDNNGPFNYFVAPIDMNDSGTVAFIAMQDNGVYGIFTGDGGTPTTIVDDSGPFLGFSRVAINNHGQVVFQGKLDTSFSRVGIFTGPDPVADKLMYTGETFMGGEVIFVDLFRGINDDGLIVFYAELQYADYWTRGLYLADPRQCGDANHPHPPGDINRNCFVDLTDFGALAANWQTLYDLNDLLEMAGAWLQCTHPQGCPP